MLVHVLGTRTTKEEEDPTKADTRVLSVVVIISQPTTVTAVVVLYRKGMIAMSNRVSLQALGYTFHKQTTFPCLLLKKCIFQ